MIGSRAAVGTFFAASLSFALLTGSGCGTDARGVEDCRSIEEARCSAASHCPNAKGTGTVVGDVESCQRFYRDQCLHGTTTSAPDANTVDLCVSAIRAAGDCAGASVEDAESVCATRQTPDTACEAILRPELLEDCRFLSPTETGEGGSSGTDGTGGTGATSSEGGTGATSSEGGTAGAAGVNAG